MAPRGKPCVAAAARRARVTRPRPVAQTVDVVAAVQDAFEDGGDGDGVLPVILQFAKHDCLRCVPFTEAVEELKRDFRFYHLVANVTEAPDLVEDYEISKLPAFVVWPPGDVCFQVAQDASPEQLRVMVRAVCAPTLKLNEEF